MPSRQSLWRAKQRAEGRCVQCGSPANGKALCRTCNKLKTERQREYMREYMRKLRSK